MNELLKKLRQLKEQGFATAEEKTEVQAMFEKLEEDEKKTLEADVKKIGELPEEEETEEKSAEDMAKEIKTQMLKTIKDSVEDNVEAIKAEIKTYVEEQKKLMEQKAGVYNPEAKKDLKATNAYIRALIGATLSNRTEDLQEKTGLSFKELTTDATGSPYGGYVVDSELSAEIRHLETEYGVAMKEFTVVPLSKNTYKANELVTDVTVYWVDEGVAIGSTQAVLGQETLELKKLGAIITMTSELIADQEIDLWGFLKGRIAEGFARAKDEAYFIGDGTDTYGSFTGLLENGDIEDIDAAGDTFAEITPDDLMNLKNAAPQSVRKTGKYYMNETIMNLVRVLKDGNDRYIFQEPSVTGPATIWGRPVVEVEVMPGSGDSAAETPFVLFGDLKKACLLGEKGGLVTDMFDAGIVRNVAGTADVNLITTDRKAIRMKERTGYLCLLPSAIKRLVTAASGS